MYKVLIVDDEYYFRQALKVSLPWEEMGFQLVGEAKNGQDALNQVKDLNPDIVMVDINMPIMDGLSFIEKAKEEGVDAKFIVLTGHSEFSYAKHALRLGVINYVLKPIDEEEVKKTLYEIKSLIDHERYEKTELEGLKQQALEKAAMLRNKFLNDWVLGNIDPLYQEIPSRSLGIDIISSYYLAVIVDVDELDKHRLNKEMMKQEIEMLIQRKVSHSYKYEGFFNELNQIVFVFSSEDNDFDEIGELCEAIRTIIFLEHGCSSTIGLGNSYSGFEEVASSYKEALYALRNRFILGNNRVIHYYKVTRSTVKVSLYTVEKRSRLLMIMRTGKTEEVEEWINEFFLDDRWKNVSLEMLLVTCFEIFSTCIEFLDETSLDINEIDHIQSKPDLFQLVEQMNSFSELKEWLRNLIVKIMRHVHSNKPTRSTIIIEEVKAFIEANYANEELKIEDISKSIHVNYSHLCQVFKKGTSITINSYIMQFRMSKAKELFDQGGVVIQEVASRVGYSDANYFAKCFKMYSGVSPSQYINNINKSYG